MIRLNKRLYLNLAPMPKGWSEIPLIGVIENGMFSDDIPWPQIERGRKIAYERGWITSHGSRGRRVTLTKKGKAMMKLTQ